MSKIHISASQLGTFKACPRLWYYQSKLKLQPRYEEPGNALRVGSAYHDALEQLHGPDTKGDRLEAAIAAFEKTLVPASEAMTFTLDDNEFEVNGVDDFEVARGRAVLRAYHAHEKVRVDGKLGVIDSVERGFPNFKSHSEKELCTLGYFEGAYGPVQVILCGRWDGQDGGAVVEHKTAKDQNAITSADLILDEQVSAMCWAATRLLGTPILQAVYNVIVKPSYKPSPRGKTETPAEFEARVLENVQSAPGRFFLRYSATRSPEALTHWAQEAVQVAEAMYKGPHWRRLKGSWDGPCRWCKFDEVCAVWYNEARREQLLKTNFEPRSYR